MLNNTNEWSHTRGKAVVPSRWQATRVTSLPCTPRRTPLLFVSIWWTAWPHAFKNRIYSLTWTLGWQHSP